jgi:hypothetical protein
LKGFGTLWLLVTSSFDSMLQTQLDTSISKRRWSRAHTVSSTGPLSLGLLRLVNIPSRALNVSDAAQRKSNSKRLLIHGLGLGESALSHEQIAKKTQNKRNIRATPKLLINSQTLSKAAFSIYKLVLSHERFAYAAPRQRHISMNASHICMKLLIDYHTIAKAAFSIHKLVLSHERLTLAFARYRHFCVDATSNFGTCNSEGWLTHRNL